MDILLWLCWIVSLRDLFSWPFWARKPGWKVDRDPESSRCPRASFRFGSLPKQVQSSSVGTRNRWTGLGLNNFENVIDECCFLGAEQCKAQLWAPVEALEAGEALVSWLDVTIHILQVHHVECSVGRRFPSVAQIVFENMILSTGMTGWWPYPNYDRHVDIKFLLFSAVNGHAGVLPPGFGPVDFPGWNFVQQLILMLRGVSHSTNYSVR